MYCVGSIYLFSIFNNGRIPQLLSAPTGGAGFYLSQSLFSLRFHLNSKWQFQQFCAGMNKWLFIEYDINLRHNSDYIHDQCRVHLNQFHFSIEIDGAQLQIMHIIKRHLYQRWQPLTRLLIQQWKGLLMCAPPLSSSCFLSSGASSHNIFPFLLFSRQPGIES